MKKTVAIQQFASAVSAKTGYTPEFCERFVVEMFKIVEDGLRDSGEARIKGFGQFRLLESGDITFLSEGEVADKINEPFSFFEAMEISEDVSLDALNALDSEHAADPESETIADAEQEPEQDSEPVDEPTPEIITEPVLEPEPVEVPEQRPETVTFADPAPEPVSEPEPVEEPEPEPIVADVDRQEEVSEDYYDYSKPRRSGWKLLISGLLIGFVAGMALCYFFGDRIFSMLDGSFNSVASEVVARDTVDDNIVEVPSNEIISVNSEDEKSDITADRTYDSTVKVEPVVTDIVTRSLARLAKKHYGDSEFWVYIYEENRDNLGHPDYVEPNTVVIIPPASKYSIDKNDPESILRAKHLAGDIYSRFKKKQ